MLEAIFVAVAGQVIAEALIHITPTDRVREWLGREPAKLAYQKALARAYTAFARQYPELAASLFDPSFLKQEAPAAELAKMLRRRAQPDPAHLAELWLKSFRPADTTPLPDAWRKSYVEAASYFLQSLKCELQAEPVFQPLFDSRALDSLPRIEDVLKRFDVVNVATGFKREFD